MHLRSFRIALLFLIDLGGVRGTVKDFDGSVDF